MFVANNISKSFGSIIALNNFTLAQNDSKVLALLGPNGSGKSTFANILVGLIKPDSGKIEFNNPEVKVSVLFQQIPLFETLTVIENIRMFASFNNLKLEDIAVSKIIQRCNLVERTNVITRNLSGGQKQTLSIILSTISSPNLLILDEPMNNLDPLARDSIRELINTLKNEGTTIILISHDLAEISSLADYIAFIDKGSVIVSGTPEEILEKYKVDDVSQVYTKLFNNIGN